MHGTEKEAHKGDKNNVENYKSKDLKGKETIWENVT
jgi:hypothetical protein